MAAPESFYWNVYTVNKFRQYSWVLINCSSKEKANRVKEYLKDKANIQRLILKEDYAKDGVVTDSTVMYKVIKSDSQSLCNLLLRTLQEYVSKNVGSMDYIGLPVVSLSANKDPMIGIVVKKENIPEGHRLPPEDVEQNKEKIQEAIKVLNNIETINVVELKEITPEVMEIYMLVDKRTRNLIDEGTMTSIKYFGDNKIFHEIGLALCPYDFVPLDKMN